jgi:glycosyltransferase involved in cell wall biosynthesis
MPVPGNPIYAARIAVELLRYRPNVLHVHDLPLVVTAWTCAAGRLPLLFDQHENFPAMMATEHRRGALHRTWVRVGGYQQWERVALRLATHVIVVCDEQRDRLIDLGVERQRITIVGNTPDLGEWEAMHLGSVPRFETWSPADRVVFYSGILEPTRGLRHVIAAMPEVVRREPAARLVIAGDGPEAEDLRALARSLGVAARVTFTGWLDWADLLAVTRQADLCVIPHARSPFIDTTYPNKLFEFMLLEKPVLVSDAPPLRRILREATDDASLVVKQPNQWAAAILRLLGSRELCQRCGQLGAALVRRRYNAATDGAHLLSVYASLQKQSPHS